jgi:hypothetical protein
MAKAWRVDPKPLQELHLTQGSAWDGPRLDTAAVPT